MSRKHFIKFAEAIRNKFNITPGEFDKLPVSAQAGAKNAAEIVATVASDSNPAFDAQRFYRTCGINS